MQIKLIISSISILLILGCIKTHKNTQLVPNSKLYWEVFTVNPAGVDEAFLTDSQNFRLYIGKYDNEHDFFRCSCIDDTIKILKFSEDASGAMKMVDSKLLSQKKLSKDKTYNNNPLFEFR